MQKRARMWTSFCHRITISPRGAMARSYSRRSVRAVMRGMRLTRRPPGSQRLRESPPRRRAQHARHRQRQALPDADRELEGMFLIGERRRTLGAAQHVLVEERHGLRPPLRLEAERSGVRLAASEVEAAKA